MDPLERLNRTLTTVSLLLDQAAGEVRDAGLSPTREHISSIGSALAAVFDVENAIYRLRPELAPKYEEAPEDVRAANRRLGEALIAAYDLADSGKVKEGIEFLAGFAQAEPSATHRELPKTQCDRLSRNYGA